MMIYLDIIIPVYNEEKRLENGLNKVLNYLYCFTHYKYTVTCVLNGCTDQSYSICKAFGKRWPQFQYIKIDTKGKGLAVKTGMIESTAKYRMMADVDFSISPDDIPVMVEYIRSCDYDLVSCYREFKYTNTARRMAHSIYKAMAWPLARVNDPQTGFKLFRDTCANDIFNRDLLITGLGFDTEILYLARINGYKITEIPFPYKEYGESKINIKKDSARMAADLIRLFFRYSIHHINE